MSVDAGDMKAAQTYGELVEKAAAVLELARAKGTLLGAAESCTGGALGATLTEVVGSSDVFLGSIVSYAYSVKASVLGVSAQLLATAGAVNSDCVRQMAEGAKRVLGADVTVSISGLAGPGGADEGAPVGTVWFGVASAGPTRTVCYHFGGDRHEVRAQAVKVALDLLAQALL